MCSRVTFIDVVVRWLPPWKYPNGKDQDVARCTEECLTGVRSSTYPCWPALGLQLTITLTDEIVDRYSRNLSNY
jgi:hypothetical protein